MSLGICLNSGEQYHNELWKKAGQLFAQYGFIFEKITTTIVDYLCDGNDKRSIIPELFLQIGKLEKEAYRMFITE